ncbi:MULTISPECIES: hypothetical protein [unclassified Endozoicomonas]|uniref:hypothetical protein n=1 Tax=unclassified Endozoicomonas TaxID=2644528 RepID=UPI003BB54D8B
MVERRNRSSLNVFERAGAFLDGAFYSLATPIGAFIMTLGGAFLGSYDHSKAWAVVDSSASFIAYLLTNPYAAFVVGFPLTVFGAKGVYDEKKQLTKENDQLRQENIKVKDLEAELEASQEDGQSLRSDIYRVHQDLVGTWLKGVSKQINLDSYSRVSIYYENRESFYLLSRYSINPKLAKVHKPKFGLNEGVISQAWQHGEHSEDNSPEFASDKDGYFEYMMHILVSLNTHSGSFEHPGSPTHHPV